MLMLSVSAGRGAGLGSLAVYNNKGDESRLVVNQRRRALDVTGPATRTEAS